ncbi:MAG: lysophospholipid acyltransferase family protein [Candidatus Rokuibacteriota bacterium]
MLYAVLKPLVVALMRLYFRMEARGAEHVPSSGAVLLVSNHSSVLDPPIIGGACPRALCFMAKAELFRIPLLGALIHNLNARPVRREGSDSRALKDALRVLQGGDALLVFPEGTRGPEGELREAKAGAGMLAVASGAAVVPVYIRGTGGALPRGRMLPRPRKVEVRFGPPLTFHAGPAEGRRDRYREAAGEMMQAIARLRDAA